MTEDMPSELSVTTPVGLVTIETDDLTDYLMGLQRLGMTLPHIDKADADAKSFIDAEIMETKVQEVMEKQFPVSPIFTLVSCAILMGSLRYPVLIKRSVPHPDSW